MKIAPANNFQKRPRLLLASASPRRRELLQSMGCNFSVCSADIDESKVADESVIEYVTRLAQHKAQVALDLQLESEVPVAVLAADTVVVQGELVFGKPVDQFDAFSIWQKLQSSSHEVITGVCLMSEKGTHSCQVTSRVEFGAISDEQMLRYWKSGEPQDKAGGYAIQGLASAWVKLVHGSYSNVVGLPLRETNELLTLVDHNWL